MDRRQTPILGELAQVSMWILEELEGQIWDTPHGILSDSWISRGIFHVHPLDRWTVNALLVPKNEHRRYGQLSQASSQIATWPNRGRNYLHHILRGNVPVEFNNNLSELLGTTSPMRFSSSILILSSMIPYSWRNWVSSRIVGCLKFSC